MRGRGVDVSQIRTHPGAQLADVRIKLAAIVVELSAARPELSAEVFQFGDARLEDLFTVIQFSRLRTNRLFLVLRLRRVTIELLLPPGQLGSAMFQARSVLICFFSSGRQRLARRRR